MAVSRKGKRTVDIRGQSYLWRVIDKCDQTHFDGVQASVTSESGDAYIQYGLNQDPATRHLWVAGRRVPCPQFENDDGTLSGIGVRRLIEWYLRHAQAVGGE